MKFEVIQGPPTPTEPAKRVRLSVDSYGDLILHVDGCWITLVTKGGAVATTGYIEGLFAGRNGIRDEEELV